jgi:hypothetical protein
VTPFRPVVIAAAALAVLGASVATATVVLQVGLEEMTHGSDVIVHATVEQTRTVGGPSEGAPISTVVTFRAIEVLAGAAHVQSGRLDVVLLGGRADGIEMRIPGMPEFAAGEEVVVFLEKTEQSFALTGLAQGVFRVTTDAGTGEKVCSRGLLGLGFAAFDASGEFSMVDTPAGVQGHPLDALLDEVRLYRAQGTAPALPSIPSSPETPVQPY